MSTRNLRADSSPTDLLLALYGASTEFVESVRPADIGPAARSKFNELNRVRRLAGHHLRQQGLRAEDNADSDGDRPEQP